MKSTAVLLLSLNLFSYTYGDLYQTYEITAYTAGYESTGKHPDHPLYGVTASSTYVQENHTIACGPELPFGTEVFIPYFGRTYICEDRGGAITYRKLDVYMKYVKDALQFGRQHLRVFVYGPHLKHFAPI